jgi:hypothetical protein
MITIDLLKETESPMLGTRPAARAIEPVMRTALENGEITLDTTGVRRIGVSFFDETLLILRDIMGDVGTDIRLIYRKAPQLESLKELAPNRGLQVVESPSGDWIISPRH